VPLIQTCVVDDPLHGTVIVHTDIEKGWVEVAGDGFPAVHLRRSEAAEGGCTPPTRTAAGSPVTGTGSVS
jgi:hypothetical protein